MAPQVRGRWHFVAIVLLPSPTRLAVYVDGAPVAVVTVAPDLSGQDLTLPTLTCPTQPPPPQPQPSLGPLLTLFYGGATEEWAAPRDTHVDVGGFACYRAKEIVS